MIRRPGAEPGELPLSGDVSIGRAFDNLIAIEDNSVSRYHAVVEVRPDGIWLCDLGSVNGTVLNGRTIKSECRLKNGDSISFGGVRVECRLQDYPDGPYLAAPQGGGAERDRTRKAGNSLPRGADTSTEPRGGASARFSDWAAGNRAALIVLAIVVPVFAIVVAAAILTGALSRSG
ncbi:MAG: FHA domain-containing protein, partial [Blastocatellia bacterium]